MSRAGPRSRSGPMLIPPRGSRSPPVFSADALAAGIRGTVILEILGTNGKGQSCGSVALNPASRSGRHRFV